MWRPQQAAVPPPPRRPAVSSPPRAGSGADRSDRQRSVGAGLWPAPEAAVGEGSALDAVAARV